MGEVIQFRSTPERVLGDQETVFLHPVRGDAMEPSGHNGLLQWPQPQSRFHLSVILWVIRRPKILSS